MPVKFLSLSSGSNGNCYVIFNDECAVMIDAGVGMRRAGKALKGAGIGLDDIDLVLVTHDHSDHVRHLGRFVGKFALPVYTTPVLCRVFANDRRMPEVTNAFLKPCECMSQTAYKGFSFIPFRVGHDATETVGYFMDFYGEKIMLLTDLGRVPEPVFGMARQCGHIIIESNYDFDMLLCGPYTRELKERIMGDNGHLSNDDCASFVKRVYHEGLKHVFLCHLSDHNNTPKTAYECTKAALAEIGVVPGRDLMLYPLPRREASEVIEL